MEITHRIQLIDGYNFVLVSYLEWFFDPLTLDND